MAIILSLLALALVAAQLFFLLTTAHMSRFIWTIILVDYGTKGDQSLCSLPYEVLALRPFSAQDYLWIIHD